MRQPLLWTKGVIPVETTEVNEWGSIHISQRVIAVIAAATAARADYVADLGTNIAEAAAEKLGRTVPGRGVDVRIDGQDIELTVRLVIRYGCRIPDVALEVQKAVKEAVEQATACTVTAAHIIVQQLVFEEAGHHG